MRSPFERVPAHWSLARVDRVATVRARIGWKALTTTEYVDRGVIFLSTPNIKSDAIDYNNVNYIPEWRYEESPELKLQPGDVLLAKDGNTLGITNVVLEIPGPATVNGSIAVLRPTTIDSRFLRYVLASKATQDQINAVKAGMGVPHLFQWDINRLPVPIPPAHEQRAIADFLDAKTARIDALSTLKHRLSETVLVRMRSALDKLLLDAEPHKVPLRRCVTMVGSGSTPRGGSEVYVSAGVAFLRSQDIHHGEVHRERAAFISEAIDSEMARTRVREGDVLLNITGASIGRSAVATRQILPANVSQHVCIVRPAPGVDPVILQAALESSEVQQQISAMQVGGNRDGLTFDQVRNLFIRVPRDNLTTLRASIIRSRRQSARVVEALDLQIALLQEHRQAIITAATTGELEVTGMAA